MNATTNRTHTARNARIRARGGFVLVFAAVVLAAAAIILGGVFSYLSFTTRMTLLNLAKSECRLAAQSVIDRAKVGIEDAFATYTGKASVRIGPRSGDAYNWFETFSDAWTIGRGTLDAGTAYRLPLTPGYISTNVNGCVVTPRFGGFMRTGNASWAIVSIVATAEFVTNGVPASVTIEERVCFATGRSRVFDYAYFVNNYGWFNGSGATANGDVRANGDLYLGQAIINGEAYAAYNDELGVNGEVKKTGSYQKQADYWRTAGLSQIRPTSPTSKDGVNWAGGYEVPESAEARCHSGETPISMPWIGDLQNEYVPYAKELGGKLSGGIRYSVDESGNITSAVNTPIDAHYNGVGPSGKANFADKGALVLVGTDANPIKIDGPVVVDNDLIIKGVVTGQGTIYSGRNIHIVGNLTYKNAPSWPHPDPDPVATATKNKTKDLVGFAAKGNIVLGDYTETITTTISYGWGRTQTKTETWDQAMAEYLDKEPYVQKYACDASDADIGYPSTFGGKYTALDGLEKVGLVMAWEATGRSAIVRQNQAVYINNTTHETFSSRPSDYYQNPNKYHRYRSGESYPIYEQRRRLANLEDTSRYYSSVCYDELIKSLCGGTKITKIDGVLYNNHGIFGRVGSCTFNGSLICRNEGIIFGTDGTSGGKLLINWDIRLGTGSAESLHNDTMGLPVGNAAPATVAWHESAPELYSENNSTNWVPGRITY